MTEIVECTNRHVTFFQTKRIVVDEKISLNISAAWSDQPGQPAS
jgi:hypothetical protein